MRSPSGPHSAVWRRLRRSASGERGIKIFRLRFQKENVRVINRRINNSSPEHGAFPHCKPPRQITHAELIFFGGHPWFSAKPHSYCPFCCCWPALSPRRNPPPPSPEQS